jgi:hypothetical protein
VAVDSQGNVYVADGNNQILKFSPNGDRSVFVSSGLDGPEGLAFDAAGNLYVANYWSGTIDKFNSSGVGGVFANTGGGYSNPFGLAYANGLLYVSIADNQIEQFNASGAGGHFTSTQNGPWFMAVQAVPESSSFGWLAGGSCALLVLSFSKRPSRFCLSVSVAKP